VLGRRDAQLLLHSSAELYEQQQGRWTRLYLRTGPVSLDEALEGEPFLRALKELEYLASLPGDQLDLGHETDPP
jgi:hypothetical protein